MTREDVEEYYKNYAAMLEGHFSEEGWYKFCESFLREIMEENKDVLVRLKERG